MDYKKNYINQKKLKKASEGYFMRGAYFDDKKGRYVKIDRGHRQSDLKKRLRRTLRRRLKDSDETYAKSNIDNKLIDFWWELD